MASVSKLSTLVALGLAVVDFVAAENYDPAKHHPRWEDLRAKRTASQLHRRGLVPRQTPGGVKPGQPTHQVPDSMIGGFERVGDSYVSAQQMFLGTDKLVYILDKVEGNPHQINGHPAWASVYNLETKETKALEVVTNTFCAGGGQLGDGRWLNLGGNMASDPNGVDAVNQNGDNTYHNSDGGKSARTILPGDNAEWTNDQSLDLTERRWYPTLEPMGDGRMFVFGGSKTGDFVSSLDNNNPTYEFWPRRDGETPVGSPILIDTVPANLYPITHLLPTGQFLLNINRAAAILDLSGPLPRELPLPTVPDAVRTYPASAATFMKPVTVKDGWNATVVYCGGSDIAREDWLNRDKILINVPASASCISMSPAFSGDWDFEDSLPAGRVMSNAIILPDSTVVILNGANMGVAGYANAQQQSWSVDDSLADRPVFRPVIYDGSKPKGQRWSDQGLQESQVARMYHSTATLLPDGSVLVSGSNPHADYSPQKTYPTEYAIERFYPLYYNKRRPEPSGIPTTLTYGGQYFDLQLSSEDLGGNIGNLNAVKVQLARTGFSTHGINFGMRMVELECTFTANSDGSATLHVSQPPPNPNVIPPGTSWLFVVVNGVPSVGVQVMVGSGKIEQQTLHDVEPLPASSTVTATPDHQTNNGGSHPSGSPRTVALTKSISALLVGLLGVFALF